MPAIVQNAKYRYSTVCRHRNIYGTEAGEAERDVYVPDTSESLQLNSNLDMDVTFHLQVRGEKAACACARGQDVNL